MQAEDYSVAQVTLVAGDLSYAVPRVAAIANGAIRTGGTVDQPADPNAFTCNQNVDAGYSWRLVYDGEDTMQASALFESEGITSTVWDLYCGPSKDDCVAFAAQNGINIPDAVLNPLAGQADPGAIADQPLVPLPARPVQKQL